MGVIISKIRKPKTNVEKLEIVLQKMESIEDFKNNTVLRKKKVITVFTLCSITFYAIFVLISFFLFPKETNSISLYLNSFVSIPFTLYFTKNFITWYYERKVSSNEQKLSKLKDEKEKIIEAIKTTETYTKVKEILKKYVPEYLIKESKDEMNLVRASSIPNLSVRSESNALNKKPTDTTSSTPLLQQLVSKNYPLSREKLPVIRQHNLKPIAQTPFPIFQPNRSSLDKLVEFLVGDGPNNRYAVICKNCFSHNGMLLKEDYEFTSFRCCYCFTLNTAKKQRLLGPELNTNIPNLKLDSTSNQNKLNVPDNINSVPDNETSTNNSEDEEFVDSVQEDVSTKQN